MILSNRRIAGQMFVSGIPGRIFFSIFQSIHPVFHTRSVEKFSTALSGFFLKTGRSSDTGIWKEEKRYCMPTSKKQLVKLNQAKKAKAEELSKQAAAGSDSAKKKLKKLEKKLK